MTKAGIYWKDPVDIPNSNTFKVLEKRKNYLIKKSENIGNRDGSIQAEIISLDKIINFTKLIINNFPNELIQKTITEYEAENRNDINEPLEDNEENEIIYTYEKNVTKNYKLNISFVKYRENIYVKLEPQKYVKTKYKWTCRGKYYISPVILKELLDLWKDSGPKAMEAPLP